MITSIGDRYDLLELLGEGGMGAVYRARDRELDEIVALKLIRPELARDPGMIERFRREVKLARRVTHVNVARTFELGSADGHVFCTMELVEGESLTARLLRDKRLPVGEAVAIACALCDGLAAAHAASVVHRDMKPDNVLLASDGRVVIADFGVATVHSGERGELSGTPAYMSPEQGRGEPATPAADVYAVGLLLYEMVVGRRAFQGNPMQILGEKQAFDRIVPGPGEAPPELAEVIGRATARDLDARLANAVDLRRALEPWAHTPRADTQPQRDPVDRAQLTTMVVLIPRGEGKMYLAEAIYDQAIALLAREPRLRVLPRADADEPGAATLRFDVKGESITAHLERNGATLVSLEMTLAIELIATAAEAIYRAACRFGAPSKEPIAPSELAANELVLQARHNMRRDLRLGPIALEQAERAYELSPTNPRVLATLAIVTVRHAFFEGSATDEQMARAGKFARAAVIAAPELFESHLALGHVEFNAGNPVVAARHYRTAIARSPHSAEAHEYMGRMLLEAGHFELALARLDEAVAINPSRMGLLWETARAYALEGRWEEHDRLVAKMRDVEIERPFVLARMASWRGRDPAQLIVPELRRLMASFAPTMMGVLIDVYERKPWTTLRDRVMAAAHMKWSNRRRRTWVAQICAEAAGWSGDPEAAAELVALGTTDGLFDLHWLDKCPLLADMRQLPYFAQLRAPIQRRAEGVLDAMYGDHELGTSETAVATS